MGYLFFKRHYPFAAMVFFGGMLVSGIAHADSASDAKRKQLLQQLEEVDKEYQTQQAQINEQLDQSLKDNAQRVQKVEDWSADQQYANEKKCSELMMQNDTADCDKLQQQFSAEYLKKQQQLTEERQQHQTQHDQQMEELSHQNMVKRRTIDEQFSTLN